MSHFDILIIGGGASGIMSAISVKKHHPHKSVALIDRTFSLGRKILVSGAGRCNITNIHLKDTPAKYYHGASPVFLSSIFNQFGYHEIVSFFKDLGIELSVEKKSDKGKLFPLTDQAKTVTALLEDELHRLKIPVFLHTECERVQKEKDHFVITTKTVYLESRKNRNLEKKDVKNEKKVFTSSYLILATGGKTYPKLGSDGSGYTLAKHFGHSIIEPVPAAVPLVCKNPLSQMLQGAKMKMTVTSLLDHKKIQETTDDVLFTQYGISGSAILEISRGISIYLQREKKKKARVLLNFFPEKTAEDVKKILVERWKKRPDQQLEMSLYGLLLNKVVSALLSVLALSHKMPVKDVKKNQIDFLCRQVTAYEIPISETKGWNEAEFTAGGIDTKEIREKTLESKKVKQLYCCGEILDVDGDIGGYNLSWAFASGFVAGMLQ